MPASHCPAALVLLQKEISSGKIYQEQKDYHEKKSNNHHQQDSPPFTGNWFNICRFLCLQQFPLSH